MHYFEITETVNKNKQLNFDQKAILNQIISFNLNNKPFIATNEWLAEYWGVGINVIKRAIKRLTNIAYIKVSTIRKKHTEGNKTWYNKRYIVPLYAAFVETNESDYEPTPEVIEPINIEPQIEIATGEGLEYDYKASLTLVKHVDLYRDSCFSRYGNLCPDEQFLKSILEYVVNHDRQHIKTYLDILSGTKIAHATNIL